MSNEKIRAMMAKVTISYQVCSINDQGVGIEKFVTVDGANFETEGQAEQWILDNLNKSDYQMLTVIKVYQ